MGGGFTVDMGGWLACTGLSGWRTVVMKPCVVEDAGCVCPFFCGGDTGVDSGSVV